MTSIEVTETIEQTVLAAVEAAASALKALGDEVVTLIAHKQHAEGERNHFGAGRDEAQARLAAVLAAIDHARMAPLTESAPSTAESGRAA